MTDARTILDRWTITAEELTVAVDENPSLRGMLLGYVAEYKLRSMWFAGRAEVTHFVKHDDHNRKKKGDLVVTYKGQAFTVESKSLQTNSVKTVGDIQVGTAQCDASDKRTLTFPDGTTLATTCLLVGEFDLLASTCSRSATAGGSCSPRTATCRGVRTRSTPRGSAPNSWPRWCR